MASVQQKHASRFLKMMLAWDYPALWEAFQQGKGLIDDLPSVPLAFDNVQARPPRAHVASGLVLCSLQQHWPREAPSIL